MRLENGKAIVKLEVKVLVDVSDVMPDELDAVISNMVDDLDYSVVSDTLTIVDTEIDSYGYKLPGDEEYRGP